MDSRCGDRLTEGAMKPEYRTLDPVGAIGEFPECIASLLATPTMPKDRTWTIGELARECDVTLRALRFYEGKGLISPTRDGATRLYDDEDVRRLKLILRLKRIGFSLVTIRELLDLLTGPGNDRARLDTVLRQVEGQVAVLEDQRREVDLALDAIRHEIAGLNRHLGA